MPVPKVVAKLNKLYTNPRAIEQGKWPVLSHVGRTSGVTYRTPLEAYRIEGGFLFVLMYGSDSDWVQNVLHAGKATLTIGDDTFDIVNPRLIPEADAWELVPPETKKPPSFLSVHEFMRADSLQ